MTRGTTYTTTNSKIYETLTAAINAGKREYSAAQNKTHNVAVAVTATEGGYLVEALPAGYPLPAGYVIVARNNGRQWIESKRGVEIALDMQF